MFCRNCGHEIQSGDRFCGYCGTKTAVSQENGREMGAGQEVSLAGNAQNIAERKAGQNRKQPDGRSAEQNTRPSGALPAELNTRPTGALPAERNTRPTGIPSAERNTRPAGTPSAERNTRPTGTPSAERNARPSGTPSAERNTKQSGVPRASVFPAEYRKYVGIMAALIAFLGLFLPNVVIEDFGLSSYMGVSQPSYSYFSIMSESEVTFMIALAVISILLVILFQAMDIPLVSLIGCAGMLFCAYMITVAVDGGGSAVNYGIGFWMLLIGGFVCIFAAFFAHRPKKRKE